MRVSLPVRPLLSAVLVLLIALSAALTGAQPARAADPLSVLVYCEATGGGNFVCDAYSSGGTGGNTFTWSTGGYASISRVYYSDATSSSVVGRCTIGRSIKGIVTVQDSSGATATASRNFYCYSIAP